MARYAQHVVIYTGKGDWASRIEDDESAANPAGFFVRALKQYLGRGGRYADPYNNIMITASSFKQDAINKRFLDSPLKGKYASAFLFPRSIEVPKIPASKKAVEDFIRAYLQPERLHPAHNVLNQAEKDRLIRQPRLEEHFSDILSVRTSPTILICSHGGRDVRCGIMGPVLRSEFERVLLQTTLQSVAEQASTEVSSTGCHTAEPLWARVGLISHIGGHKFAGNVIIYIPPDFEIEAGKRSPLAGHGIWYGRVEPRHVEGIVQATLLRGQIIKELFRGGIASDGEMVSL